MIRHSLGILRKFFLEEVNLLTPRTDWWPGLKNLSVARGDIFAGVLVAMVLIPNALAYALLAGLPPTMGLYAALVAVPVAALWGSSSLVITAPVGIVSLLTATTLLPFASPGTDAYITLAILLALLVGLLQLIFGFFRLGFLTRFVPHSTIIGFTSAAAIIISVVQLPVLLGLELPREEFLFQSLFSIFSNLGNTHLPTLALSLVTIFCLFLFKSFKTIIPASLLVLIGVTAFSFFVPLEPWGIKLMGEISSGLPHLSLSPLNLTTVLSLIGAATIIALVGFVETYSIAQSLGKNKEKINSDQELVGQGFANIGASLVGGLPVSGSFSVSALNSGSGSKSILSALSAAVVIFLVLLVFIPVFKFIPKATLSVIVLVAVLRLVDIKKMREVWVLSSRDGVIATTTFVASLLIKPDQGIFLGIFLALVLFLRRVMQPQIVEVGLHSKYGSLWTTRHEGVEVFGPALVIRLDMSLIYSNSDSVLPAVQKIYEGHIRKTKFRPKALVLVCAGVNQVDLSGIEMLNELEEFAKSKSMEMCLMVVKDLVYDVFEKSGLLSRLRYLHSNEELIRYVKALES